LLQYFAIERYLHRLSKSAANRHFVLKGALLLTAWRAPLSRPTLDIDLAGRTSNALRDIENLVAGICAVAVEPDGIEFPRASIQVTRIKEDADYEGVRGRFHGVLARARVLMQLDIAFGDVIVPGPAELEDPTLLEFAAPVLRAYPKEAVIAEKLEALAAIGLLNSHMKDYFDLAVLSRMYPFDGETLAVAIAATFRHRGTTIDPGTVRLTEAFCAAPQKPSSGARFCAGAASRTIPKTCGILSTKSAAPVLTAASAAQPFRSRWEPGGPWT
jgi:hypothetical protein